MDRTTMIEKDGLVNMTEIVKNELNPTYKTPVVVDYYFEK
jgi:hypothetical protein